LEASTLIKGRIAEPGQPPGDFGLAHAGGTDEDDVLGSDLILSGVGHLTAAPPVSQGNGHRPLGRILADDVFVQFGHDIWVLNLS
jgi:hypothetical protein